MWESISDIIKFIVAIGAIIAIVKAHYNARKQYPPLDYNTHSEANIDTWRWRKPEDGLGLELEDRDQVSILRLPPAKLRFPEQLLVGLGYVVIVLFFLMLVEVGWTGQLDWVGAILASLLILPLVWAMLRIGTHVTCIELHRDEVHFILRYAQVFPQYGLLRRKRVKRAKDVDFDGQLQGIFSMTTDQEMPDYELFIIRKAFLGKSKQCLWLRCNPSQGAWIVSGLQTWKHAVEV